MSTSDFEIINPSECSDWSESESEIKSDTDPEMPELVNYSETDSESSDHWSYTEEDVSSESDFEYVTYNTFSRTGSLPDLHVIKFDRVARRNSCPSDIEDTICEDMNIWAEEQEKLLDNWVDSWGEYQDHTTYDDEWNYGDDYELSYDPQEYDDPNKYYEEYDRWRNYYDDYWTNYVTGYDNYNYCNRTYDNISYNQPQEVNWNYYDWINELPSQSDYACTSQTKQWTDDWNIKWNDWNNSNNEEWSNNEWDNSTNWFSKHGDVIDEIISEEPITLTIDNLLQDRDIEQFEIEDDEGEEGEMLFETIKKNIIKAYRKVKEVYCNTIDAFVDGIADLYFAFVDLF